MLVIIADRRDAEAAALVQRWRDHDAEMLSIGDLSAPGWCHRVASPGALTAVVNGRVVPTEEITGVLTLLPAVTAPRLGRILPEDRHYVASEMTAFLAAWLSELACPVVNRPGTVCLMGPNWQLGQWIHAAARLGIPVCPQHRRIAMNGGGRPAQAEGPPTTITVAGQHCVGDADAVLSGHARRLADAAGVTLLAVHFDGPTEGARLLGAGLRPRVASPEIADAILGHLLGSARC